MTTQPKTEQLADELENTPFQSTRYEAAAELLRLEAANAELLESLKYISEGFRILKDSDFPALAKAREAIAKHGGSA